MNRADLDRVALYAKGYRRLMKGGLDPEIHAAGTPESMLPNGGPAYINIEDVEALLEIANKSYTAAMGILDGHGIHVARAVAAYHIGDASWANTIISAYLNPEEASAQLARDKES